MKLILFGLGRTKKCFVFGTDREPDWSSLGQKIIMKLSPARHQTVTANPQVVCFDALND